MQTERSLLLGCVRDQARIVDVVSRELLPADPHGDHVARLLGILDEVHDDLHATLPVPGGKFFVLRLADGKIQAVLTHPETIGETPPQDVAGDGPWQQAMAGNTGTAIATDHRGVPVLAAFSKASTAGLGMLAQVPIAQIRAPFVHAGILVVVVSLVLIAVGTMLFFTLGDPVIRRLHDSENRFRALFGNMRTGAVVLNWQESSGDFIFADVNRAGEEIGGFRREQVAGRRLTEMLPAVESSGLLQVIRRVARSGRAEAFPAMLFADGRMAGWREGYVYELPTEEVVVLFDDVTDRIRAEQAMRESEARYRRLFDRSPVPIIVIDPSTMRTIECNQALLTLLGYSREEFAGMPMVGYEARLSPEQIHAQLAAVVKAGDAEFETDWRCNDATLRTVSVNMRAMDFGGRTVLHAVAIDVTARIGAENRARELFDQLLRMERISEMGQLAAALAHELKQPLTAALNYINVSRRMIEAAAPDAAPACAFALKAAAEIERTSALIRGLRHLVQHGTPQRTHEDINTLARDALQLATMGPVRRNLTLVTRFAHVPGLYIDRIQVQQVLLNLIQNALEAMQSMPVRQLMVETSVMDDGSVQVAIGDSGPGLHSDVAARLFNPYVTSKPGGIGIGLSLCRAIIRAHGGRIWWEPDPEGGCIFRFSLPAWTDSATTARREYGRG